MKRKVRNKNMKVKGRVVVVAQLSPWVSLLQPSDGITTAMNTVQPPHVPLLSIHELIRDPVPVPADLGANPSSSVYRYRAIWACLAPCRSH